MVYLIHNAPLYTVFLCVQSTGRNHFSPLNLFVMKTPLFPLKYKVQGPAEVPRGSWQGARGCEWFVLPGNNDYGDQKSDQVNHPFKEQTSLWTHNALYIAKLHVKVSTIVKSTP